MRIKEVQEKEGIHESERSYTAFHCCVPGGLVPEAWAVLRNLPLHTLGSLFTRPLELLQSAMRSLH